MPEWIAARDVEPPMDGRPLAWLEEDGCSVDVCMFICGMWWTCSEEEDHRWRIPFADASDMKNKYWSDLPRDMIASAARVCAEQYDFISLNYNRSEGSGEVATITNPST